MNLSPPELYWLAGLLLARAAPLALALSAGCWLLQWRRLSGLCALVALLAILVGAAASMNPFCMAGYIASDGSCAEE